jgi:hypothetical protein
MKERGKFLVYFILVFAVMFLLPIISAIDTKIKVTTYSNHSINLNFLPTSGSLDLFQAKNLNSGDTGDVEFIFSSEMPTFDITAFIMKDGERVVYQRFDGNTAGESLHLILMPSNTKIIKNYEQVESLNQTTPEEPVNNNQTTTNQTIETVNETNVTAPQGITGLATSENKGNSIFSGNIVYYIFGALFLVIAVSVGRMMFKRRAYGSEHHPKEVRVKKLSDLKEERKSASPDLDVNLYQNAISDAEKKIAEAQDEIKKLKNRGKIEEVKKRLIDDEKELMRLRKGED